MTRPRPVSVARAHSLGRGLPLFLLASLALGDSASAASFGVVLSDTAGFRDTYLQEDAAIPSGSSPNLFVGLESGGDRRVLIHRSLSGLDGITVLQAWITLRQSSGGSIPLETRVYPVTESWSEAAATWTMRQAGVPWTRPGGTRDPHWTGRALTSSSTVNRRAFWQVGPILRAWQSGEIPNHGLLIEPVDSGFENDAAFLSKEFTADSTARPELYAWCTDEPPAAHAVRVELQPHEVHAGGRDTTFMLYVWVDASRSRTTPSGVPTGVDEIVLVHGGALKVSGVIGLSAEQGSADAGLLGWNDDGARLTIYTSRLGDPPSTWAVRFRAKVFAGLGVTGIELPVHVDDTTTPSVWPEIAWPRDVDGTTGNGDGWLLRILDPGSTSTPEPVSIDLAPDSIAVRVGDCAHLDLFGRDSLGNRFDLEPDTLIVTPRELGTIDETRALCGSRSGAGFVIAHYGALRDTSLVTVSEPFTAEISAIELRDLGGSSIGVMTPGDTHFVDVELRDGDGFQDVLGLDFVVHHSRRAEIPGSPAFRAEYRWRRGQIPPWTMTDPLGSSWSLVESLCGADTGSNATAASNARLAFVPGAVARASEGGPWIISVAAISGTPPDTTRATLAGLDVAPSLAVIPIDSLGEFAPGSPGAVGLPLHAPSDGRLSLALRSNAPFVVEAALEDMPSADAAGETLRVGAPNPPVAWAIDASDSDADGFLGTSFAPLGEEREPLSVETPAFADLGLWLSPPADLPAGTYQGGLRLRIVDALRGGASETATIPLAATLVDSGLAAEKAIAEVQPKVVVAGARAQAFTAYLLPSFRLVDTGIDRVMVHVPQGYGAPGVSLVRIGGLPVNFQEESVSGRVSVRLETALRTHALIEVAFTADVPGRADLAGSDFVVLYDHSGTPLPPQAAVEGDANGVMDSNRWSVAVLPGPLNRIEISPESASCFVDSTIAFSAAAFDAFGNRLDVPIAWSTDGGAGSVNALTGLFTGLMKGTVRVVARSGGVADTAIVSVKPDREIVLASVTGPAKISQGDSAVTFQVRIDNRGARPVVLDSLALIFSRHSTGDADRDFGVVHARGLSDTVGVGRSGIVEVTVSVGSFASTGRVEVDVRATAHDTRGHSLTADGVTSPLVVVVGAAGIVVTASQVSRTASPGYPLGAIFDLEIENRYLVPQKLRGLTLTNETQGPGTRAQLDAELGTLELRLDDGDGTLEAGSDNLLSSAGAAGGAIRFEPLDLTIPASGTVRLLVGATIPVQARDGDVLDLSIRSAEDVRFSVPVLLANSWPVDPPGSYPVDGMTSRQLSIRAVETVSFLAGSRNNLALDVRLPGNGYQADVLERLAVRNLGTAAPGSDVEAVKVWVDDGDQAFDPARDRLRASLAHTGDRWEATGLLEPVPVAGLLVFVTVDLSELARDARTLRLALPTLQDPGVGMASGNNGPNDRVAANPFTHTISTVDRVIVSSAPFVQAVAAPGQRNVLLQSLVFSNTYSTPRVLSGIAFRNRTVGPGAPDQLDREVETLRLRDDSDGDGALGDLASDPVLGTAFFSGGRAEFSGFAWTIPAGQSRRLFLSAEVSSVGARDGDTLATEITRSLDVVFTEPTALAASMPLSSATRPVVDGLAAGQVALFGVPAVTLGPGDGPVLALDMRVPANGYSEDTLDSLRIVNLGDAGVRDIGELRLWKDGGDGAFSPGAGDDQDLGPLTWVNGVWQSGLLSQPLSGVGCRLFVGLTASGSPAESTTVRLAVPLGGIVNASNNDGPIDRRIESAQGLLISSEPLLATLEASPGASTIGQTVTLRMIVRNAGSEDVTGISPSAPALTGNGSLTGVSGPVPATVDLAPASADTFHWTYSAAGPGDVQITASAQGTGVSSGLPRRSLSAAPVSHRVFASVNRLDLSPVQSMPSSINQGQADVIPFSLTFTNRGGAMASDARLLGLRIRLEDEAGGGIVPSELLGRVVVNEGIDDYLVKTTLEGSGAEVDLTLASPVLVTGLEPVTLSLRLDVLPTASASAFRVAIPDSAYFAVEDAHSGAPVIVGLGGEGYPLRSGLGRIVSRARELLVQEVSPGEVRVGQGQAGTPLMSLRLGNQSAGGFTSDVRVESFDVTLTDTLGAPLAEPADRLTRITVSSPLQTHATRAIQPGGGSVLTLTLNPPLRIPVGSPLDLTISGDIAAGATLGAFRMSVRGSEFFDATDSNTGDSVAVSLGADPLGGPPIRIESPARTLMAGGTPLLPQVLVVGQTNVVALRAALWHPGSPGTARIRMDGLTLHCQDDAGRPLVPASYLSRARFLWNGLEFANVTDLPASGGSLAAPIPGLMLEAGDTARVEVVIDVSPVAPSSFFELAIPGDDLAGMDANSRIAVAVQGSTPLDLPLISGLSRLAPPARDLGVGLVSEMPAAWAADGNAVRAGVVRLGNGAGAGSGSILVDHLVLAGADRTFAPQSFGAAASRVMAYVDGVLWAESPALEPDSTLARLAGDTLEIEPGAPREVALYVVPRAGGAENGFRVGLGADGVGVIQPASALLEVRTLAEGGAAFPLWTEAASASPTGLGDSYSNFPNPFAAGREATSFVYYLREDARVTLRVWTSQGDEVAILMADAFRAAGLHQSDRWDGRNGRGTVVTNGVYVAELIVKYADGARERVLRKTAVVR